MKLRLVVVLIVLASLCAISVENVWAQNLPPLQSLVWTTRASYNVGETVPILYLVTKPAFVTITVAGPGGTTNFNNGARGSTVLTFNGRAGQPTGRRTVTMRATANDNPWEVITVQTSFNVGQSPPSWGSPPPTFSAPA